MECRFQEVQTRAMFQQPQLIGLIDIVRSFEADASSPIMLHAELTGCSTTEWIASMLAVMNSCKEGGMSEIFCTA